MAVGFRMRFRRKSFLSGMPAAVPLFKDIQLLGEIA
jgi:hypothetical protein